MSAQAKFDEHFWRTTTSIHGNSLTAVKMTSGRAASELSRIKNRSTELRLAITVLP
jgi:hypothetical protein